MSFSAIRVENLKPGLNGTICALVGYSVIFLLPSFVESAAQEYKLNEQQLGWLGAADTAGLAISTSIMAFALHKFNLSRLLLLGLCAAVLGNILSLFSKEIVDLLWSRLIAGLGEGLLVVLGMYCLAKTHDTNRWFAIYTAAAVILQAIGLFLLPRLIEHWGFVAVIYSFMLLLIAPLLCLRPLSRFLKELSTQAESDTDNSCSTVLDIYKKPLFLSLLAVLFFYISIGTFWTYAATIGTSAGFSFEWVSEALSLSMIGGLAGALLLVYLGPSAKNYRIYVISAAFMVGSLLALLLNFSDNLYLVALIVYSIVWSIIASKLYSDVAEGDSSGRFITACQPLINIGFALGPLLASQWVLEHGNSSVIYIAVAALLFSMLCIYPLVKNLSQTVGNLTSSSSEKRADL
ncbi:MFS transporter [uncultured Pseudoteredinibacter sp.]|uniref:MFS transporter n=1 Tax=uncultured Pseudoteredinibacter sp. TaxID=1641701 RepID=UPI00262F6C9A|nr:MFS transporter [uncultured Pseudoteredinibacter sp.]